MPLDATMQREEDPPLSLPHHTTAEQCLLGALMMRNEGYAQVASSLTPTHFANGVHARIYEAIGKLIDRGIPATPITLKSYFENDPALLQIGGHAYLGKLVLSTVTTINGPQYATLIKDAYLRRELIGRAQDIMDRARVSDIDDPASRQLEAAESALYTLSEAAVVAEGTRQVAEAAMESIRRSEGAYKTGTKLSGVASGLTALDDLIGGFQPGDLHYVGKRPSMGGTALAVTLALNAARAGVVVGFWSVEMTAERISRRLLAQMTGISADRQARGELGQADFTALLGAQHQLQSLSLFIDDTPAISAAALWQRARLMKRRQNLGLVIVDYLQLLGGADGKASELRDRVPYNSGALRDIAKDLGVPVVALAQLTPDIDKRDNKRPTLSDIRWSHDAEQDAAVVIMLYRDEYYLARAEPQQGPHEDEAKIAQRHSQWSIALAAARNRAELIVQKNRDGQTGVARVTFDGPRSLFHDEENQQGRFW